jgi:hypothetical protein
MRGALQVRISRLPSAISGPRWSSWISRLTLRRRPPSAERLETMARLCHERQHALRMGEHRLDLDRRWVRRL